MQAEHVVHPQLVEHSLLDHPRGTAPDLLGGLEEQDHAPGEHELFARTRLDQGLRRAQRDRHVSVVPTGVHASLVA